MGPARFREHPSGLRVEPPEFKCDAIISENITDPLPNTAFFMGIIGSAGSGKTSLLVNFLTNKDMYSKAFDHVHLFCPKTSLGSLKDDIWEGHPADKMHDVLNYTALDKMEQTCRERAQEKPKPKTTLVVIDDMTVFLKQKDVDEKLRALVYNRRHLYLSIMILVQSYNAMPLALRKTLSHFFLFRPRNKREAEAIWEELMFVPKTTGAALLRFTFRDKYDFLMGNCGTGEFYRNFNLIDIDDGEGGVLIEDNKQEDKDALEEEIDE